MSARDEGRSRAAGSETEARYESGEDGRIPGLLAALIGLLLLIMACGGSSDERASSRAEAAGGADRAETVEMRSVTASERAARSPDPRVRDQRRGAQPTDERGTDGTAGDRTEPGVPGTVSWEQADSVYREGDFGRAADFFAAYVERRPENPWGHYMLGLSARHAGDPGRAEAAFGEALERDPGHVKSLVNLGRTLLDGDRPEEAVSRLERARELDPENGDALRVLGNALSDLGRVEEAVEAYREALALNPDDGWSLNNLGLHLIRQGRHEEALPPLARATKVVPGHPVFLNNLGSALEGSGYPGEAIEAYRGALEADSAHEKASVSLARVEATLPEGEIETVREREDVDLETLAAEFRARSEPEPDEPAEPSETEPVDEPGVEVNARPDTDSTESGEGEDSPGS